MLSMQLAAARAATRTAFKFFILSKYEMNERSRKSDLSEKESLASLELVSVILLFSAPICLLSSRGLPPRTLGVVRHLLRQPICP